MEKGEDKMDNRKNIKIFTFILALLTVLFTLSLTKTSAETPGVTVSGKFVDTIKNIQVSRAQGGSIDSPIGQWEKFKITADYDLKGKDVKAGDTTELVISDPLIIENQSFEIKTDDKKNVIAYGTVDKDQKKISLTYTDYVQTHSDVKGNFFFYARVDYTKHPEGGEIPIQVTVNNRTIVVGNIPYQGVGNSEPKLFLKTSEVHKDDPSTISYVISINQTKESHQNVTVEDHLKFTNAEYVKGSIRVLKGTYIYKDLGWQLPDAVDVTDQHPVTVSDDGQSFVVKLGNVSEADQYRIVYDVHLNYTPVDGEVLDNEAILKAKDIVVKNTENSSAIQLPGGSGQGYVFTIHIHKVGDANQPLAGAKFKVVRQANNQVIGEYVTDANGDITVNGLLKDKYILTELQAPEGYTITTADTPVNAEDFSETDHAVTKTIVNPKAKPKETKATIELDKALTGRDLKDGEFSFELYEGATKLQTVTNKNGKVTFDPISYKEAGEHTYTVKEVVGNTPGITYDTTEKQVTVKVTQDGQALKADLVYPENKTFNNTYTAPQPAKAKISASKILEGAELKNGEFNFQLLDETGKVLQTKQNAEDGTVAFDDLSYSSEDAGKTFHYTIKEVIPESKAKGMTYDEGSIDVTVTVTKDDASNTLKASVAYGDKKSFTNKLVTTSIPPTPPTVDKPELKLYSIQLHKVNQEGKALVGAVFGLFEADGTTPVANPYGAGQATATSDANGLVTFTGLEAKDYVVRELTAPDGYQLSDEVIKIVASDLIASNDVVDKGNVVNKPFTSIPPTPPTVDKPELKLYNIQLHKVNEEGKGLLGAVFGLYEADGTTPVANPYGEGQATATSDENGLVTFIGFEAKDYVIKELTAPTGYQLLTNPITVSASDFTQAKDLVVDKGNVVNNKIPPYTPPTPPTTPSTPPTPSTDKPKGNQPSGKQSKEGKKQSLPATGETVSAGLLMTGLALASAGSMLVAKKRDE